MVKNMTNKIRECEENIQNIGLEKIESISEQGSKIELIQ
jgi:hypothetical protein